MPGAVNFGEIIVWLRQHLAADAIICNGAGNFAAWVHRFYRFRRFASRLMLPLRMRTPADGCSLNTVRLATA